jgi:hypothetical protein
MHCAAIRLTPSERVHPHQIDACFGVGQPAVGTAGMFSHKMMMLATWNIGLCGINFKTDRV